MPLTIPPELKSITPFIRRAEELDKDQYTPDAKEVAYFCRSFAMEKAMKVRGGAPNSAIDTFLMALMSELEQTKKTLAPGTSERGKMICETFALSIFERADEEDRAGMANKETARIFYNASTFFDILDQFGDIDEEASNKNKYAKWKATEIMKALKEGRAPEPGGYGEAVTVIAEPVSLPPLPPSNLSPQSPVDNGFSFPSAIPNHHPTDVVSINSIPQAPPVYSQPPIYGNFDPSQQYRGPQSPAGYAPQYQSPQQHPGGYNQPPPQPTTNPAAVPYKKPPTMSVDERSKDALELCAFAMAAIKHKEIELAKDRLREALKRLG